MDNIIYFFKLPYKKVIWLDCDLVVQTDIAQLYNIELGNNLVAGVRDILTDNEEKERIEWNMDEKQHINGGVLLINNKLWKKENIDKKCLDEITSPHHTWSLMDQDIINFVCQDRVLVLPPKWNFLNGASVWNWSKYDMHVKNLNPEQFNIIHYNSSLKMGFS